MPLNRPSDRIEDREMEKTLSGALGDECCDASPPAAPIEASEAEAMFSQLFRTAALPSAFSVGHIRRFAEVAGYDHL